MPRLSLKNKLILLWIVFFLVIDVRSTQAFFGEYLGCKAIGLISPSEAIKCIFEEFGISEEMIKENTPYLNVARMKKPQPQVSITFSPADPKPGEKVTAIATPTFFGNNPKSLYYTWFLQTADCPQDPPELEKSIRSKYPQDSSLDKKCNLDKNYYPRTTYGIVDAEDYKIKAMRIYASNNFDWESTNYSSISDTDNDGHKAVLGGADQKDRNNHCYFYDSATGVYTEFTFSHSEWRDPDRIGNPECFHLFPGQYKRYSDKPTGDNSFGKSEEEFWRTDPNDPDTAGTGYPDEANVAGLDAKEFSWIYQAGDKVGVAVEGISYDSTLYTDSSYKIMWGFPGGTCSDLKENINGKNRVIHDGTCYDNCLSNEDYLNQCIVENMLSPTEGGGSKEKLEVSLSFSPANPVNDKNSEENNGDWISVVSTIENSSKMESLHYTWSVYAGDSADADGEWGEPLLKNQLTGVEQTVGAGIPNLRFKANFPNAPKYLKVKLNVSEKVTSGSGGTRLGHAEVVIPLSSFDYRLSVFNSLVDNSLVLSQGDEEICKIAAGSEGQLVDAAVCQVAPNQIIAAKADISLASGETWKDYDFLWTLNGQSLTYLYDPLFQENSFKPGRLVFFPVLAAKGSVLNLSLTATNQKTGVKTALNKTFLVSEPAFKIVSNDESTAIPKILGHYVDLDEKKWPDYSQTEFLALKNSLVKFSLAQFSPNPFPEENDFAFKWYWNGTQLAENSRSLPPFDTKDVLENPFSLKAEGLYSQDKATKQALQKYWNVALNEFYEKRLSQEINITLVDSLGDTDNTAANTGQKILASFISSVPAYFAFLFRLIITTFVLLASTWILLAFFPQKNE